MPAAGELERLVVLPPAPVEEQRAEPARGPDLAALRAQENRKEIQGLPLAAIRRDRAFLRLGLVPRGPGIHCRPSSPETRERTAITAGMNQRRLA